jgi:Tol biopolymer transport system component/putative cell wall-binding protein
MTRRRALTFRSLLATVVALATALALLPGLPSPPAAAMTAQADEGVQDPARGTSSTIPALPEADGQPRSEGSDGYGTEDEAAPDGAAMSESDPGVSALSTPEGPTPATVKASVDSDGWTNASNPDEVWDAVISGDGRYLVYTQGFSASSSQVYRHDTITGERVLVSQAEDGIFRSFRTPFTQPSVSGDGNIVAFTDEARVSSETGQIHIRDIAAGTTELISGYVQHHRWVGGNGDSASPTVSADGRYVAFASEATDLDGGAGGLFVHDREAGTTTRLGVALAEPIASNPSISPDGDVVVFEAAQADLVAGAPADQTNVYLYDLATGALEWVSRRGDGGASNGDSDHPVASAGGEMVAFRSSATDLTEDVVADAAIYVHDRGAGTVRLVMEREDQTLAYLLPALTSDGRYLAVDRYRFDLSDGAVLDFGFNNAGEAWAFPRASWQRATSTSMSISDDASTLGYVMPGWGVYETNLVPHNERGDGAYVTFLGGPELTATPSWRGTTDVDPGAHWIDVHVPEPIADVKYHRVFRDDAPDRHGAADGVRVHGLTPETSYVFRIEAMDRYGNWTEDGPTIEATTETMAAPPMSAISYDRGMWVSWDHPPNGVGRSWTLYQVEGDERVELASRTTWAGSARVPDLEPATSYAFELEVQHFDHEAETGTLTAATLPAGHGVTTEVMGVEAGASPVQQTSSDPAISADGQVVAFTTVSEELLPGVDGQHEQVVLRGGDTTLELVSVAEDGAPADGRSHSASVSDDGQVVAFVSAAGNLDEVEDDGRRPAQVYVRDRSAGTTTLISRSLDGGYGDGTSSAPVVSADGRWVVFASAASNLVEEDPSRTNIFLYNRQTGETVWVSRPHIVGVQPDGNSEAPVISADGRHIAFESRASNLVGYPVSNDWHIYTWDRVTGEMRQVSIRPDGQQLRHQFDIIPNRDADISADGRYVLFHTTSEHAISWNSSARSVQVWDRETGRLETVSRHRTGPYINNPRDAVLSGDGRFVAFRTDTATVTPVNHDGSYQIYVRDLTSGELQMASVSSRGEPAASVRDEVAITPDGSHVVYASRDGNHGDHPDAPGQHIYRTALEFTLEPPSWREGAALRTTGVGQSFVTLVWDAARGTVAHYAVLQDGEQVATTTGTSHTVLGLSSDTEYAFAVQAVGLGEETALLEKTVRTAEGTAGEAVLQATPHPGGSIALAWDPAEGPVDGYEVLVRPSGGDWNPAAQVAGDVTTHTLHGLPADTELSIVIHVVVQGVGDVHTSEESVTTLPLFIDEVSWHAPGLLVADPPVAWLGGVLSFEAVADAGRTAIATVEHLRVLDDAGQPLHAAVTEVAQVPMAEDATAGVYRGSFRLEEGIAAVHGVEIMLCDDAGGCVDVEEPLDLEVGGAVEVDLDVPTGALEGGRLSVQSPSVRGAVGGIAADGVARADRLRPADDHVVRIFDEAGQLVGQLDDVVVPAGRVVRPPVDVTLRWDPVVRVEHADGAPARGTVTLTDDGDVLGTGALDANGRHRFHQVPQGTHEVTVRVANAAAHWSEDSVTGTMSVVWGDDDAAVIAVPARQQGTIVGAVTSEGSTPLPGAAVTVTQRVGEQLWTSRATADADGRYRVRALTGEARVAATHGGMGGEESVTVTAGEEVSVDLDIDLAEHYDLEIRMFTQYAGQPRQGPINLDWRTSVHFRLRLDGVGVRGPLHRWPAGAAATATVCADGREAGLPADCVDVEWVEDGLAVAELTLAQPAALVGGLVDEDGTPWGGWWRARLTRLDDGRTHVLSQRHEGSDLNLTVPEPGDYELTVTAGRREAHAEATVETGQVFDIGQLVLGPPGRFSADSRVIGSRSDVAPGDRVTMRVEHRNAGRGGVEGAVLLLDQPRGTSLETEGLTVDGEPVDLSTLDTDGNTVLVALGDLPQGARGVVRFSLRLDDDAVPGKRLDMGARITYRADAIEHTEAIRSSPVQVRGISIDAPPVTASRTLAVTGTAPAGEAVQVFDGRTLIGEAQATRGGLWSLRTQLVDRGDPHRHTLRARLAAKPASAAETIVRYDGSAPAAIRVTLDQGVGPRHSFDPRAGLARFPFTFVPSSPFILEVEFDQPDRVVDPVARIGGVRIPLAEAGGVHRGQASVRGDLGPIWLDYDVAPAPFDIAAAVERWAEPGVARNRLPLELDDLTIDAATRLQGGTAQGVRLQATDEPVSGYSEDETEPADSYGEDLSGFDISDEPHDDGVRVQTEPTPRWGMDLVTTLVAREIDYEPTAADEAFEARTGVPVWNHSISWSLSSSRLRVVMRATVPLDALPGEDPEAEAVALLAHAAGLDAATVTVAPVVHAGDGEVRMASRRVRALRVVGEVVAGGSSVRDAFSALSGADRWDELSDLHDLVDAECASPAAKQQFHDHIRRIANHAAATQVAQAGLVVVGGLLAASTAGLATVGVVGAAIAMDTVYDLYIDDLIDDFKERMADHPDCEEPDGDDGDDGDEDSDNDDDGADEPRTRDPIARPVWIYDPAGYVFEAVESNRIEGATVTVLEGDPADAPDPADITAWAPWDAEWFGQTNPLVTGPDGRYAWDVPDGWWHTRADLDGYVSVTSEVLRVLPEHFDVHLGLVSLADPDVEAVAAWADDDAVTVRFDHWMRVTHVADAISVHAGGVEVSGRVRALGAQPHSTGRMSEASKALVAPHGEPLAQVFAFTPDDGWMVGDEVTVTIDGSAQAYNLKMLGDDVERVAEVTPRPVGPTVTPGPDLTGRTSQPVTATATFTTDVPMESHTAEVAWGDGTVTTATVDEDQGTVTASHLYVAPGTYPVTITVTDQLHRSSEAALVAEITSAALGSETMPPAEPSPVDDPPVDDPPADDPPADDPPADDPPADDPPAGGPGGDEPADVVLRLAGSDRIATAIALAQDQFPSATDGWARAQPASGAVVLARADDYPDALAGTALALDRGAPLLLTYPEALDARTRSEINRLLAGSGTVYFLGGEAAIGQPVADDLRERGYTVERVAGPNRFATAVAIAGQLRGHDTVLLASGTNYPDALAAGAATGVIDAAVLLTAGETLPTETSSYLSTLHDHRVLAVGGPAARAVPHAEALVGATRLETAVAVAERFFARPGHVGVATSQAFPDALTGGAHAGRSAAPLLLTHPQQLSPPVQTYLRQQPSVAAASIYGGTSALSADIDPALGRVIRPD